MDARSRLLWLKCLVLAAVPLCLLNVLRTTLKTQREAREYERTHVLRQNDAVSDLTFSPDGQTVYAVTVLWNVLSWSPSKGRVTRTLRSDIGSLSNVRLVNKGRSLVGVSENPVSCQWWNAGSGASETIVKDPYLKGDVTTTRGIDFMPLNDGRLIACTTPFRNRGGATSGRCTDAEINRHFWDMKTGRPWGRFRFCEPFKCAALTGDGAVLATGDSSGTVKLWDVASARLLRVLTVTPRRQPYYLTAEISDVEFSPDGKTLAVCGGSNVTLWSHARGKLLHTLDSGEVTWMPCLRFSANGARVAVIQKSSTLHVWNVQNGSKVQTIPTNDGFRIESLAISPDGNHLASGNNGVVKLWDLPRATNTP